MFCMNFLDGLSMCLLRCNCCRGWNFLNNESNGSNSVEVSKGGCCLYKWSVFEEVKKLILFFFDIFNGFKIGFVYYSKIGCFIFELIGFIYF